MSDDQMDRFSEKISAATRSYRELRAPSTLSARVLKNVPEVPARSQWFSWLATGMAVSLLAALVVLLNQAPPSATKTPQYPSLSMIKMPSMDAPQLRVPTTVAVPIKVRSIPKLPGKPIPVEKSQTDKGLLDHRIVSKEQHNENNHA